jgi:hypothetical protein
MPDLTGNPGSVIAVVDPDQPQSLTHRDRFHYQPIDLAADDPLVEVSGLPSETHSVAAAHLFVQNAQRSKAQLTKESLAYSLMGPNSLRCAF